VSRGLAVAAVVTVTLGSGCRDAADRRAADVRSLRERAAAGIEAAGRYCAERAALLEAAGRGEPGHELALAELLLAPDALDDFCAGVAHADHAQAQTGPIRH